MGLSCIKIVFTNIFQAFKSFVSPGSEKDKSLYRNASFEHVEYIVHDLIKKARRSNIKPNSDKKINELLNYRQMQELGFFIQEESDFVIVFGYAWSMLNYENTTVGNLADNIFRALQSNSYLHPKS